MQYCDLGFRIATGGLALAIGAGGSLLWLAATVVRWRTQRNADLERADRSRSKAIKADVGNDPTLRSSRFFLLAASLLFVLGSIFYFVASPSQGYFLSMRINAELMLALMLLGALALVRSAMLAWESLGPGSVMLRIGVTMLCSILIGGTYLVADNLKQMNTDQCGVFPLRLR